MEPLKVDIVYFYPRENAQPHNTLKYEAINVEDSKTTVIRRGQPFNGVVRFTRPYDENLDKVQFLFTLGDSPKMETQGSFYLLTNLPEDKHEWGGRITDNQGDTLIFEITTPVGLPVGNWSLRVITRVKGQFEREIFDFNEDLYIIFNPWNPDDQTHMEETELLQEYVLNDVGKVWVGPIKTTRGKPWVFGQFDGVVLDACMFVLDRANIPYHQRGDPVKLTRAISRIVNSNDDAGVLVGRWDGQYEDGTAPAEWSTSVDILEQYLVTKQEVPYGQCWVFAAVVTTICRALGIPSRVVTNIVSAHDANGTLTVDKYYDENMVELNYDPSNNQGADSIWNYHVWNDVWMNRPDLPQGFGGWQAIDATPQEVSGGMYQCGPAPLEAVKQGVLGLSYDVDFLLSTVNADLMRWKIDHDAPNGYSMVDTNNYHIGRMIITKKPYIFDPVGDKDREDITSQYKYTEGTASERLALMNGVRYSPRAQKYYSVLNSAQNDVTFKLRDIDTVAIGNEFRIAVDIENNSDEGRNIKAAMTATSVFYTGVKADIVKKVEGKIFVGPHKKEEITILVKAEDYLPKLVEYCNMKISAMATVDETKQSWADDDDFQVLKPDIVIKFNDDLIINTPATVILSFPNPLEAGLTGGEFRVTSPAIAGRTLRIPAENVEGRSLLTAEIPIQPIKMGKISIVATYKSNELKDITGAGTAEVFEA